MKRQDKPQQNLVITAPVMESAVPHKKRADPSLEVISYAVAALANAYSEARDKAKLLPRLIAAAVRVAALAGRDEADEQLARLARMQKEATRLAAEEASLLLPQSQSAFPVQTDKEHYRR